MSDFSIVKDCVIVPERKRVLILDHGARLGGVEKFIANLVRDTIDYDFERVCVDVTNHRLGYSFYVFLISRRVKMSPDLVISCHIDTSHLGYRLSKKYACPHVFREPSGLSHKFMTPENAEMLKESICVALTNSSLGRWRNHGFEGPGFVIPPFESQIHYPPSVWPRKKGSFKAVMVANLYSEKRHLEVIQTCARINDAGHFTVSLDIIGNSNNDEYGDEVILTCAKYNGVNLIQNMSMTPRDFKAYDFGILASSHEGFGNVLVEFIQAGLPFVTTYTDGAREILKPNSRLVLKREVSEWHLELTDFLGNPSVVMSELNQLQKFLERQDSYIQQFKDVLDSNT